LVVKAQRTRRPAKVFTLQVPQQIEHRRRPWVTHAPNRPTHSNDARMRTTVEGNLWLSHASASRIGCSPAGRGRHTSGFTLEHAMLAAEVAEYDFADVRSLT
jgi:hypothetical protein